MTPTCLQEIHIPVAEIVIELDGRGGGQITSYLVEWLSGDDDSEEAKTFFKGAADALESLILGHACAGIDVTSPEYVEGLHRVIDYYAEQL